MSTSKTELFESVPVRRAVSTMAIPTIISQLINLIYNVVDTFFIGRTGDTRMVAGVTVAFTLFVLNIMFSNLFGVGGGSQVARLLGSGESERARQVSAYSVYGAIVSALAYSAFIAALAGPLLRLLGASDDAMPYALQYLYLVVVAGNLPLIVATVMAHLLRNTGYSRQASIGLSLGGVLNIALDPLLMFVIFPRGMEVFGAALATLISNIISCVFLLIVYRRVSATAPLSMNLKQARAIKRADRRALYAVGIPSGVLTGLFDLANIFLNAQMALYGDTSLAALGIVMKVERLPNAFNIGICQGMLPIIAYNYSSGDHRRMNEVIRFSTMVGLGIAFSCVILFEIFAETVAGVFLSTGGANAAAAIETLSLAAAFLRVRCLASPLQFMNYRSSFIMQATGDGRGTLVHACVRELVCYIPFMFILNAIFGRSGLVCALIAGEGGGMLFALWLMHRKPVPYNK